MSKFAPHVADVSKSRNVGISIGGLKYSLPKVSGELCRKSEIVLLFSRRSSERSGVTVKLGQVDSQSVSVPEDETPILDSEKTSGSVSVTSGKLILGDFLIRFDGVVNRRGP